MTLITLYSGVPTNNSLYTSEPLRDVSPLVDPINIFASDASPASTVQANPGSLCIVKGAGASDGLWQKVSGYDTSGWVQTSTAITPSSISQYVDQPANRTVSAATDTVLPADIGAVVSLTRAGGQAITLNSLAASLIAGKVIILTWQGMDAATVPTFITGSGGVTINGGTGTYAPPVTTGMVRISMMSKDGINFFTGDNTAAA